MPYARWPASLPQCPFGDTPPDYKPNDNTIRSSPDTGPAKLRRRFTARTEDITVGPLNLTLHQFEDLTEFVQDTLSDVMPFLWKDFRTDREATYRFKQGWASVTHTFLGTDDTGVEWWTVTLDLEILP